MPLSSTGVTVVTDIPERGRSTRVRQRVEGVRSRGTSRCRLQPTVSRDFHYCRTTTHGTRQRPERKHEGSNGERRTIQAIGSRSSVIEKMASYFSTVENGSSAMAVEIHRSYRLIEGVREDFQRGVTPDLRDASPTGRDNPRTETLETVAVDSPRSGGPGIPGDDCRWGKTRRHDRSDGTDEGQGVQDSEGVMHDHRYQSYICSRGKERYI